jgi:hypothetical protein
MRSGDRIYEGLFRWKRGLMLEMSRVREILMTYDKHTML